MTTPNNSTTFGTGANNMVLMNGAGSTGVTASDVCGTGWDITVTTATATGIRIEAGDLAYNTGDGIYYTDTDGDGEPLQSFMVASNGGDNVFDLRQFWLSLSSLTQGGTTDLIIKGYHNGVEVASKAFNGIVIDHNGQSDF